MAVEIPSSPATGRMSGSRWTAGRSRWVAIPTARSSSTRNMTPRPKAERRSFVCQEGGWYVRCSGGEMWIGTKRIAGATHVRSGDMIRMSASGPEFSFQHRRGREGVPPGNTPRDESAPRPFVEKSRRTETAGATVSAVCRNCGLSLQRPLLSPQTFRPWRQKRRRRREKIGNGSSGLRADWRLASWRWSPFGRCSFSSPINITVNSERRSAGSAAASTDDSSPRARHPTKTQGARGDGRRFRRSKKAHVADGD